MHSHSQIYMAAILDTTKIPCEAVELRCLSYIIVIYRKFGLGKLLFHLVPLLVPVYPLAHGLDVNWTKCLVISIAMILISSQVTSEISGYIEYNYPTEHISNTV